MAKATEAQIAEWKEKHGTIFEVEVGEKIAYLKSPTKNVLGLAITKGKKNSLDYVEAIWTNCFIGGDEIDLKQPGILMGVAEQIDEVLEVATVRIKKL